MKQRCPVYHYWLAALLLAVQVQVVVAQPAALRGGTVPVAEAGRIRMAALRPADSVYVCLQYRYADSSLLRWLEQPGSRHWPAYRTAAGWLHGWQWQQWQYHPAIAQVLPQRKASPELAISGYDPAVAGILQLGSRLPQATGAGSTISIKEDRFDNADTDLLGRGRFDALSGRNTTLHASLMATMAAGAGNSSIQGRGVAPAATLVSTSFASLLPEGPAYYQQYGIGIQNHSYGVGIESEYALDAAAYDESVRLRPDLLHVFSVGNSGAGSSSTGPYAGLTGWANLTGSFKMSKNSLAVAALDSFDWPETRSSRGPAHDGRLKPELAAYGEDGSSGAAALVSGTAAVLQQWLRRQGAIPTAHLQKALLITGTSDIGLPGPDYATGYGKLNAYQSVLLVQQAQYQTATLQPGVAWRFQLQVPAGYRAVATLCWTDTAATAGAARALVHDLELRMLAPNGDTVLPWVLSTAPQADSLRLPARRGIDSLNVIEQVTGPALAGATQLWVRRRSGPNVPWSFAIAWRLLPADSLQFDSPAHQQVVDGKEGAVVRWQYHGADSLGTLWLQDLPAGNRRQLATRLPLAAGAWAWRGDNGPMRRALLQMEIAGRFYNSDTFLIQPPLQARPGYVCGDSALLVWPPVPGATAYQVATLSGSYLQPLATIADTAVVVRSAQVANQTVAVTPLLQAQPGSFGSSFQLGRQGVGCYVASFLADYEDGRVLLDLRLGADYGLRTIQFERQTNAGFVPLCSTAANGTRYACTDTEPAQGANRYRAALTLTNGTVLYSPVEIVYHSGAGMFALFPNPALRQQPVRLISRYSGTDGRAALYDLYGRRLWEVRITDVLNALPVAHLPAGMYLLKLYSEDGRQLQQEKLLLY